jgi:hypothetical protein
VIGFTTPWVLAGLLVAAVPILLHLFARREPPTVDFPAVQYLADTARHHQRRLNLQHLLLLLVRTLLIVTLVLAAAGPTTPGGNAAGHAPTAMVLIFDNSLSSALTAGGTPAIDQLRVAARAVLDRASPDDALWLMPADGLPRRGDLAALGELLDSLAPLPVRLDLGIALSQARAILAGDERPGETLIVTDLQRSALSAATGTGPVTVAAPPAASVANLGLSDLAPGSQPWMTGNALVTLTVAGQDSAPRPVSLTLGQRAARPGLVAVGRPAGLSVPVSGVGWTTLVAELAPDELRLDDRREVMVRIAPPARVRWEAGDRFLAAAAEVLLDAGRIVRGDAVTLGDPSPEASVVMPPADPARLGALNRALAARGVSWRYGALAPSGMTDSVALLGPQRVLRRYALTPVGADSGEVLIRLAGAPWLVRSGATVLLASRLDTTWTGLPLSAEFVPFVDALVNRLAAGELVLLDAAPGDPVSLPALADAVLAGGGRIGVEGGAVFVPGSLGPHFIIAGRDTLGVLNVNPDPRETLLEAATAEELRDLWPGVRVVAADEVREVAFTASARTDLRPPLLWLALLLALGEAGLAAGRRSHR